MLKGGKHGDLMQQSAWNTDYIHREQAKSDKRRTLFTHCRLLVSKSKPNRN